MEYPDLESSSASFAYDLKRPVPEPPKNDHRKVSHLLALIKKLFMGFIERKYLRR